MIQLKDMKGSLESKRAKKDRQPTIRQHNDLLRTGNQLAIAITAAARADQNLSNWRRDFGAVLRIAGRWLKEMNRLILF